MALAETAKLIASLELKDLFSKSIGNAEKSLKSFDTKLDKTASRSYRAGQQIGHGIQNSVKLVAAAVASLATISAGVIAKGIAAASDLNETVSKVGVVFKEQASKVLAFGKTSAAALGLSENAALSAAGVYGNLFVSMGLASKKSADMSVSLVKLAADLASFNNIDPAEALDKLRAGLTGESEPLKTLGININEQTLKAKALELGLVKLAKGQKQYTAVLDPATKAQAAYALIFEQSKTAQGDFARTSGGLANQVRILKANFTDMLATIGGPVLPQVAKVFQRINLLVKENQPQVAKLGQAVADLFTDENLDKGVALLKGAVGTFKAAAPFLEASAKATLGFVQAAVGLFKSLPAPLQGLLAGGFALNKLTGGLVTNIAGGIADLIGKSRGASPANPVFVSDVAGGLGGAAGGAGLLGKVGTLITKVGGLALVVGGLAGIGAGVNTGGTFGAAIGAGSGAALIGGGALLAGPLGAIAGSIAAVGKTLLDIRGQSAAQGEGIASSIANQIAGGAKLSDLQISLAAVDRGINDIQANPLNVLVAGDALDQLRAQRDLLAQQIAFTKANNTGPLSPEDRQNRSDRQTNLGGGRDIAEFVDASKHTFSKIAPAIDALHREFRTDLHALITATKANDIAKAAKRVAAEITKGVGSVSGTKEVLADLRKQLGNTHDPKLQAVLRSAINQVTAKLPGREFAARQLAKADALVKDGRVTRGELKTLQGIERDLKNRGLPHAASQIQAKIDAAKKAQTAAAAKTTSAIHNKKWQFTNNVVVNSSVSVNPREMTKTQVTMKRGLTTLS